MSNVLKFTTDDQRSVDEVMEWANKQQFDSIFVVGMRGEHSAARFTSAEDMIPMIGLIHVLVDDMKKTALQEFTLL